MSEIIFDDLEIDWTTMISDPEGFDKACREKAEELKGILKVGNSVQAWINRLPETDWDSSEIDKTLSDFYYEVDANVPTTSLADVASKLRKLATEIEYIANSRAQLAFAEQQMQFPKAVAHELYTRLREAHKLWVKSMSFLKKYEGTPLPPMPGNYGSDVELTHYTFKFEGDNDTMMNWVAVCKRIGVPPMNMMDTVDYVESHPETKCTVVRFKK